MELRGFVQKSAFSKVDKYKTTNDASGPKTIQSNASGLDVKKTNVAERTHFYPSYHPPTSHKKQQKEMSLYTACSSKTLAEARALMTGDIDRVFKGGNTPIFPASSRGHVGIVKALIESGADVNRVNQRGDTPLLLACSKCPDLRRIGKGLAKRFRKNEVVVMLLLRITPRQSKTNLQMIFRIVKRARLRPTEYTFV